MYMSVCVFALSLCTLVYTCMFLRVRDMYTCVCVSLCVCDRVCVSVVRASVCLASQAED